VALRVFRFRRFSSQLLFLLAGLIAVVQIAVYLVIRHVNERNAIDHIESNLTGAVRVFRYSVDLRKDRLAQSARIVSADWPMRTLYLQETLDRRTLRSTLMSYADRLEVPIVAAFNPEGELLANTTDDLTNEQCGPFRHLIQQADAENVEQASDFAYLSGRLHVLVVVPFYAPKPNIIGWFGAAFPIDDELAKKLKATTQAEVTFIGGREKGWQVLATTLPGSEARIVADHVQSDLDASGTTRIIPLTRGPYVTLFEPLPLAGETAVRIALQRSLDDEMVPARELENNILLISMAGLAAATLAARSIARNVSQPVRQLAGYTKKVAAGDYTGRIELPREDELGQLATAFNQMTAGLAERDEFRDLLGKVVSPEIARQLMQSGVKLGGEEREVTVFFCDLRDFTGLSEKMAPTELLSLLNRYLDRMSTIIEKHSGVIDKYIGDAIMALFGAPVDQPDSAIRALAAAREMTDALEDMNQALVLDGQPPLSFGIGINTARVVAGNMGSKTRLNYTVIGDGVNLAARLETLTKDPKFATTVIVSDATAKASGELAYLRPLGEVTVKGKTETVQIYAVDIHPRPWARRP
jgi:adenylate cyclase